MIIQKQYILILIMIQLIIIGAWLKLLLEIIMVQFLITIKPLKLIHN